MYPAGIVGDDPGMFNQDNIYEMQQEYVTCVVMNRNAAPLRTDQWRQPGIPAHSR